MTCVRTGASDSAAPMPSAASGVLLDRACASVHVPGSSSAEMANTIVREAGPLVFSAAPQNITFPPSEAWRCARPPGFEQLTGPERVDQASHHYRHRLRYRGYMAERQYIRLVRTTLIPHVQGAKVRASHPLTLHWAHLGHAVDRAAARVSRAGPRRGSVHSIQPVCA